MTDDEARKDIDEAEKKIHEAREDLDVAEKALERAKVEVDGEAPVAAPAEPAPVAEPAAAAPVEAAPVEAAPVAEAPPPVEAAPAATPAAGGKWTVEYLREECIGAGACVAANADYWTIDTDGKANLKSATFDDAKKVWVLEIEDEAQLQKQRDAAGVCPVNVIHIVDPAGNKEN